ncbi:MAG: flagellar hook capping FlgD N-terminal domain-containing protein [Erythrobacter sp.]|uniref:flagellar hook assembly protein FlgD n=1 Tax=Erythrobacter sp. TaxID=1042 RepID=UPI002635923D|nr:flagellar hook capping FlgD N-terminal domain-containing protein [Erythrobacter sp.]MDJ0979157.1 flagellar hook capping FlgD N-terminal domain-containing protein [Erythrobacter sp.]
MTTPISQSSIASTQETLDRLNAPSELSGDSDAATLGQADFLRLLTESLLNQDPLEPVDNEEMLAQLAQFSTLEAETASSETLTEISEKLDALTLAQEAAASASQSAADAAVRAAEAAERAVAP